MKKLLAISLALATIGGVGAVQAQDVSGAGAFVSAKAGSAHWKADGQSSDKFAYDLSTGYRWALSPNQSLGAEVGYANFGKLRGNNALGSASLEAEAGTLGANYRYTFGDGTPSGNYFVQTRAGYMRWHDTAKANLAGVSGIAHDNGNGWYAGAAVGHDFTPNFGLSLAYDFHRANMDNDHVNFGVTSVGAEYRF